MGETNYGRRREYLLCSPKQRPSCGVGVVGEGDGGGGRMKRRISEVLIADIQLLDLAWLLDPSCEVLGVKGKMEGVAITYHYVQTEAEV